jgi:hypothetical protein
MSINEDEKLGNLDQNFLESEDGKFLAWAHGLYHRELDIQADSRTKRANDMAFYDGDQHTEEELAEYADRNQTPRVFNEVKPTVDWLLGGERRIRTDWAILPRTEDDSKASIHKTKLAKYIDDINNARWHRSEAYSDMTKGGEGWVAIEYLPNQDGEHQIMIQHEHWRYMIADSKSRRRDMTDMQYIWRVKIIDLQSLINHFPEKETELVNLSGDMEVLEQDLLDEGLNGVDPSDSERHLRSGTMNFMQSAGDRDGVKVYEMWYKQTEKVKLLRGEGSFNNQPYDEKNQDHAVLIAHYGFKVAEVTRQQMYCAMYTDDTVLYRQKSPYKHNRFPFVRRYAYLKDREGTPYGVIRSIKDPQSDLNIRRNKALHMLSSVRVVMEEGAVEDESELSAEVARWDGIVKLKPGNKRFEIQEGSDRANQQLNVGEQNSAYIRQISGVTGENRGMDTNATSGIAIQARQEQGTVISTVLTDMHSLGRKLEGELILSLIEQFMDKPFQFRITADNLNDKVEFARINDESEPETDITKTQSDFVVAERDYRTTMRQALSEQMLSSAGAIAQHTGNPQLAVAMLTAAIELQDLPDKDRLIDGLRKASGLPPSNETEEERQQREQQENQAKQQQQEQQQAALELEMKERTAKIAELEARAAKTVLDGEFQKVRTLFEKINSLKSGIETGTIAVQSHGALPVVDQLLEEIDSLLNLVPEQEQQQGPSPEEQQAMMEQQQMEQQQAMMQQQEQEQMQMQQPQQEQPIDESMQQPPQPV